MAAVPADGERFAYICTGTGRCRLELDAPVLGEASRAANFTNELGLDGTVRYLRNTWVCGLLQECVRAWGNPDLGELLRAAAEAPALRSVVDAGERRVPRARTHARADADACRATDSRCRIPRGDHPLHPRLARPGHRKAVAQAQALADHPVDVVHIVGGGTRNTLLCQLTADACGLPVVAGPAEAAALGNVLVQARAHGLCRRPGRDATGCSPAPSRSSGTSRVVAPRPGGGRGPAHGPRGRARRGMTPRWRCGALPPPPPRRTLHSSDDRSKEPPCVSPSS
ncbi:hypothetical protein GCM10023238_00770 [Streptomyces heliomycini]